LHPRTPAAAAPRAAAASPPHDQAIALGVAARAAADSALAEQKQPFALSLEV